MKSPLQALQIELIEYIVTFLELRDISSLRLTCRALEDKASQGSFTAFFKHKNVELTTRTLQDMVRVTNRGHRLGCFLQYCTITGIVRRYDETTTTTLAVADEGPTEHHHLQRLLTQAFRNLKQQHGPKEGLASLCFRVAARIEGAADGELTTTEPDEFRSWRAVWEAARRTFNVTMAALNESQLRVDEHLDVFGSLKGCSLACDTFLAVAQESAARHVFASLKRLTVSLSAPPAPPKAATEHQSEEAAAVIETEVQTQSRHSHLILQDIMQVLRIMPVLESLKLHWYNLGVNASTLPVTSSATPWESNISSASITGLKECSLHGIYVSESHFLQFLEAVHPTSLTLTDIRLVSGTYAPIFKYLTDLDTPVTYTHLDDIREGNALLHFDIPGNSKFRSRNGDVGPSILTRQGSHNVKEEPIRYRFAPGRPLGSGERNYWLRSKAREFGPPEERVYNFVELNSQKSAAILNNNEDN
jgi:hypothetical protein